MKKFLIILLATAMTMNTTTAERNSTSFYKLSAQTITGDKQSMSDFQDKVVLIVNTASRCGFTPQYKDLQEIYEQYSSQGLVILGFPSNDFMNQEPGSNEEIKQFCSLEYGVTFPMFARISVKGSNQDPIFELLTTSGKSDLQGPVKWNFEKFLLNRQGELVARYDSATKPNNLKVLEQIRKLLSDN